MAATVVIDATDGALARRLRVKELIPWFDGERLDDVVDYLNYVFVPSVLLVRANLLPAMDAPWLAALPLIASAYGFCHKEAKTADQFFLGFPSYWNIVVFYFYAMQTPLWVNGFVLIFLSALVFVPIKYLYPSRSPVLRKPTLILGSFWGVLMLILLARLPEPPPWLVYASLFFPLYYAAVSLWLHFVGYKPKPTGTSA